MGMSLVLQGTFSVLESIENDLFILATDSLTSLIGISSYG